MSPNQIDHLPRTGDQRGKIFINSDIFWVITRGYPVKGADRVWMGSHVTQLTDLTVFGD